jgi:hypothetical protein
MTILVHNWELSVHIPKGFNFIKALCSYFRAPYDALFVKNTAKNLRREGWIRISLQKLPVPA